MIKVLQFGMSSEKYKGGIEAYLINQLRNLPSDVRYDFINNSSGVIAYEKNILRQGNVYNLGCRPANPIAYYWRMFKLFYDLRNEGYAAIIINASSYSQDLPFLLAKWIGIKHRILHAHGSGFESNVSFLRKIMFAYNRLIVKHCVTEYWACSKQAGEFLFGNKNAFIVRNGIDVDKYRYDEKNREKVRGKYNIDDEFVIGHVGRFSPVKNHLFLIDVFFYVKRHLKKAKLMLVGDDTDLDAFDGYLNRVKEKIAKYHLENDVIFTGNIDNNVEEMYQAMDLFALPSFSEGFPLVSLEAQSSGLPCVVSTGVTEEVVLTDEVHRCDISNVEDWGDLILSIYHERKERKDNTEAIIRNGYSAKDETIRVIMHLKEMLRQ